MEDYRVKKNLGCTVKNLQEMRKRMEDSPHIIACLRGGLPHAMRENAGIGGCWGPDKMMSWTCCERYPRVSCGNDVRITGQVSIRYNTLGVTSTEHPEDENDGPVWKARLKPHLKGRQWRRCNHGKQRRDVWEGTNEHSMGWVAQAPGELQIQEGPMSQIQQGGATRWELETLCHRASWMAISELCASGVSLQCSRRKNLERKAADGENMCAPRWGFWDTPISQGEGSIWGKLGFTPWLN